jgi:uncharacterized protein
MADKKSIRRLSDRIAREFKPDKIILFGSHAYGRPGPDSDVDLLVIMRHEGRPERKSAEIRLKVQPAFAMDVMVRSPEKVRERLSMGDPFMKEILAKGKVLYEADHR